MVALYKQLVYNFCLIDIILKKASIRVVIPNYREDIPNGILKSTWNSKD